MPFATRRLAPGARAEDGPGRSADIWEVLDRLGVDPVEHLASLLREGSDADDKRKDEAARQLLPYCYERKGTAPVTGKEGTLIGRVRCDRQET